MSDGQRAEWIEAGVRARQALRDAALALATMQGDPWDEIDLLGSAAAALLALPEMHGRDPLHPLCRPLDEMIQGRFRGDVEVFEYNRRALRQIVEAHFDWCLQSTATGVRA